MKHVDVNPSIYIDSNKENNKKNSKFKVDDHIKISKCKNVLQNAMFQIHLKKFLLLQKLKIVFSKIMLLVILKAKILLKHLKKTNCKKNNNKRKQKLKKSLYLKK